MIRLNLLSDSVEKSLKGADPAAPAQDSASPSFGLLPLPEDEEKTPAGKRSKLPFLLGALVLVAAGAGGYWYFTSMSSEDGDEAVTPAKPVEATSAHPDSAAAPVPAPAPAASKPDSAPAAARTPTPEVSAPATPVAGKTPAVNAPVLNGDALRDILSHAHAGAAVSSVQKPTRFDALPSGGRTAYEKFAFQRILSIVKQVAPADGLGFSMVRIKSPGILFIQGQATRPDALQAFRQGLTAQSLTDLSVATGSAGTFSIVARLPFNPSFGAASVSSGSAKASMQQALDLAHGKGLILKAAGGAAGKSAHRISWSLKGEGGWDAVDAWLTGLQSMSNPIGFTSLSLAPGGKGKLIVTATAICYAP